MLDISPPLINILDCVLSQSPHYVSFQALDHVDTHMAHSHLIKGSFLLPRLSINIEMDKHPLSNQVPPIVLDLLISNPGIHSLALILPEFSKHLHFPDEYILLPSGLQPGIHFMMALPLTRLQSLNDSLNDLGVMKLYRKPHKTPLLFIFSLDYQKYSILNP